MQHRKPIQSNGSAWEARIVLPGERYGRNDCLVYDPDQRHEGDPLIEYWDMDNVGPKFPEGQFVSRYYLSTLLEDATRLCQTGLDLQGDVPAWKLDGPAVRDSLVWALGIVPWQAFSEAYSRRISELISEPISEAKSQSESSQESAQKKDILKIRLVFRADESADTSTIGEYSNEPFSPREQAAKAGLMAPYGNV